MTKTRSHPDFLQVVINKSGLKLGLPNGVDISSCGLLEGFIVSVYIHPEYDGECYNQRRYFIFIR